MIPFHSQAYYNFAIEFKAHNQSFYIKLQCTSL